MAGIPTDEPRPRVPPLAWQEYWPPSLRIEATAPPASSPSTPFADVLYERRSGVGGALSFERVSDLLWHVGSATPLGLGRAAIPTQHRAAPSAGGLHPIRLVAIDCAARTVALYDPLTHSFHMLPAGDIPQRNDLEVLQVLGRSQGCTIRLVADLDKVGAAYTHPESLVMRDAGCLIATLCLCAAWLDLKSCPLGFLGQNLVEDLGFPATRFLAVGAVQLGS
ncbi:nitroreductase family protein [Caulobacter segnis]|uniref:nitroreductase family protein n=1 Tax=Caulobacter segnis TaxID=88688 RepID=UPI002866D730|nr:nitroreductase family protein [Caulobacter segnis]MDR6623853.1 hypothetical protein [Caulobacter segnis]